MISALQTPTIAVVTSNRTLKRHVTRALGSAGYAVQQVAADRDAIERSVHQRYTMHIADIDLGYDLLLLLLEGLSQHAPELPVLVLSHSDSNTHLARLLDHASLNNLIVRRGGLSASRSLIDEHELIVTCTKLIERDIFGIEKYLPAWGIKLHRQTIDRSTEKYQALEALEHFLEDIDCHAAIIPEICNAADELLMNAIFNAPRDLSGEPKYVNVARSEAVCLQPEEQIDFSFACDGRHVALAVGDPFGSLQRSVILRYLRQSLLCGRADIEHKQHGAGLGLSMVFNSINQLVFNIHEGLRTEVIALFYVRNGAREFRASGRSLNIFVLRGPRASQRVADPASYATASP